YPEKVALIYREKNHVWTYEQFNAKANQLAQALLKLGVNKGDVVSTFLYNTSEFALTLFASAKIGAIFNPINYRLTANELHYILNNAESKVLVFEDAVRDVVTKTKNLGTTVEHYLFVDQDLPDYAEDFEELLNSGENVQPNVDVDENDMYIMM